MDIASRQAHRALAYLAALNKHGCFPTTPQFAAYASAPDPMDPLADLLARYPIGPAESMLDYLARVHWVSRNDGLVRITDLGAAVLAALAAGTTQAEGAVEVVLTADDPLALSHAVKQLAALGPALLVDPYFRLNQLALIVNYTEIDRVLMSDQVPREDRQSLKHALDTVPMSRRLEVRMAKKEQMHDRSVIPSQGAVLSIGTSLNYVGQKFMVLAKLSDVADALRRHCEELWHGSETLAVGGNVQPDDASSEQSADHGAPGDERTAATGDAG